MGELGWLRCTHNISNWNENALSSNVVILPRHLQSRSIRLQMRARGQNHDPSSETVAAKTRDQSMLSVFIGGIIVPSSP